MTQESRELFAALVRPSEGESIRIDLALLCVAAETQQDLHLTTFLERETARLDALATAVPADGRADQRLRQVLNEFHGEPTDYGRLDSSLLPDVISRRRGLPILLSAVWTEVARRADIPAFGVGLPGHFVVGIGDPRGSRVLVDPFKHGTLLPYDKARELVAATGRSLRPEDLEPADPIDILARVLGNITNWASTPERARQRLWAVEIALLLPRKNLGLTREYGEALIGVGRYSDASRVLEEYADIVESAMPLEAENARRTARNVRSRLN
jgi:regulator of sirC expression with transglutaminase-like and TPR domain